MAMVVQDERVLEVGGVVENWLGKDVIRNTRVWIVRGTMCIFPPKPKRE
jgi:hypothetical protein